MSTAQQFPTTNNNKESNMYMDTNELPATDKVANDTINTQAAHIVELETQIIKLEGEVASKDIGRTQADEQAARLATQVTQLRQAEEDYRHDVRSNIGRIEEVLHSHARDCDDQELIDGLIDQINEATRNGFPELRKCTRMYELTITYVVEVQAISEEDARDNFIDGEYDHLIELSDYYQLDVDWGVV
jgi:FtsZ-binding cell division protein ZapB